MGVRFCSEDWGIRRYGRYIFRGLWEVVLGENFIRREVRFVCSSFLEMLCFNSEFRLDWNLDLGIFVFIGVFFLFFIVKIMIGFIVFC